MWSAMYEKTLRGMDSEWLRRELAVVERMRYTSPKYSDEVKRKTVMILQCMWR